MQRIWSKMKVKSFPEYIHFYGLIWKILTWKPIWWLFFMQFCYYYLLFWTLSLGLTCVSKIPVDNKKWFCLWFLILTPAGILKDTIKNMLTYWTYQIYFKEMLSYSSSAFNLFSKASNSELTNLDKFWQEKSLKYFGSFHSER